MTYEPGRDPTTEQRIRDRAYDKGIGVWPVLLGAAFLVLLGYLLFAGTFSPTPTAQEGKAPGIERPTTAPAPMPPPKAPN